MLFILDVDEDDPFARKYNDLEFINSGNISFISVEKRTSQNEFHYRGHLFPRR